MQPQEFEIRGLDLKDYVFAAIEKQTDAPERNKQDRRGEVTDSGVNHSQIGSCDGPPFQRTT